MQVGMKEEILSPSVEHGEEADLGASTPQLLKHDLT
jgi:hypothetical protein